MFKYVCKRLLQSMVTLVIVATTVFLLLRLMPEEGYFAEGYDKMDEAQIEAALTDMGLRDPLPIQLKNFFVGLLMRSGKIHRFPSKGAHYKDHWTEDPVFSLLRPGLHCDLPGTGDPSGHADGPL